MARDAFNREQTLHLGGGLAEFNRRLASDEFAGSVPNPSVARSIKPQKETNTAES